MYGKKNKNQPLPISDKNPNRVTGGIKAQGVDSITMVSEDGSEKIVPTQQYVQSLEDQIRKHRSAINVLERKVSRQDAALQTLNTLYSRGR